VSSKPERSEILSQLERISASEMFGRAGRMNALLAYLVETSLKGGARLDQRAIAMDVFRRNGEFDPASDAIVRAEVGRLRSKLLEYYSGPGVGDPLRIELRRGSYLPMITRTSNAGTRALSTADPPVQDIRYCRADDGVSIAYSVCGVGYPLFCLPTWMSHLETDLRNPMLRHYWSELGKRYRVIRFDCRGFGLSDRDVPDFTVDTLASDLQRVADTLGLSRFALFGPSGGAMIGTACASKFAERVSHLVFLGGFIRGPRATGDPDAIAHADAIDAAIRAGWGRADSLFRQIFTTMLVPNGTPEQHRLLDQAQLDAGSAHNAARFHNLLANADLTERAATIRAETLIFHGTHESVPFKEGQYSAARIPNARLVPLATGNHILLETEPAWRIFLEELDRFLPQRC
jgi:pimeloyl-ACP methyl ester carboxylesterase